MIKKYIRGNAERGEEVIAELEKLGGVNISEWNGRYSNCVYIINDGEIDYYFTNSFEGTLIQECFEEIHLPEENKPKGEPKFDPSTLQPFDKVLVRNDNDGIWQCGIFSHLDDDGWAVDTSHSEWRQFIPYNDDTKHLVGTNRRPPKFYDICKFYDIRE